MSGAQDQSRGAASTLRIEGEMSIYRAAEFKAVLLDALAQSNELEIDLSAVSEIDSAGVQLLVLAKKTAQAQGGQLKLVRHSHAVLEVFELFDLASYFGDPLVIAS
jgi:anti-anti-sigma factor